MAITTASSVWVIDVVANTLQEITPASGLNTDDVYNIGPGYGSNIYGQSYDYSSSSGLDGLTFAYTDYARWSLDNWGDYLVCMKEADGQIWVYDPKTPYDDDNASTDTTAATTTGSAVVTVDDETIYDVGDKITGTGIPDNVTVISIDTDQITLSSPATETNDPVTLTYAKKIKLTTVTTDADPLRARGLIVSAERYMMLYGADDIPRRIRWSAAEDYTTWTNTTQSPSEAGYLEVATKGFLMAMKKVRAGILVFSSVSVELLQYIGPPYIYGLESLAEACGPVSSACIQQIAERTVWLSTDGFWVYDGQVSPLPCPILEKFLSDADLQRGGLVAAGAIREFGEVIWFYCSNENDEPRPDAYILWGTRNNTWSIGRLSRDAYSEEEAYVFPIAIGPDENGDTYIWAHEVDRTLADDGTVEVYAETGAFQIGEGERLTKVIKIWHDISRDSTAGTDPKFTFYTSPSADSTETSKGPFTPQSDGSIDVRFQGKQVRMKIAAPISKDWTLGKQRLEVMPGGIR